MDLTTRTAARVPRSTPSPGRRACLGTIAAFAALQGLCAHAATTYLPTFEQGQGVVLSVRPPSVDAARNIRPGSVSGLDGWGVSWRRWGSASAAGRGTYFWHTPDGSDIRAFPSTIVLGGVVRCGGDRVFTRITGTFTGRVPPGMRRTVRVRAYRYPC